MSYWANDNPRKVWTLTDEAPEWLQDAVYEAHQGTLPCDWIYEECKAAFDAELEDEDAVHEHADSRVDIYTKNLAQWYADMCLTSTYGYAEDEAKDMGCADGDINRQLMAIQYCAIRFIASTIMQARE